MENKNLSTLYDYVSYFAREIKSQLSKDGQKIKEVSNAFQRIVDDLGFNDGVTDRRQRVVFHTCRHTFASWLAIQGTPIYTIAKLMGHKSISMSERYAHLSPDHKKQAVMGLERAFNGKVLNKKLRRRSDVRK